MLFRSVLVRVSETRLTFDYDLTAVSPPVLYVEDKKVLRYQGNVEHLHIVSITNTGLRMGQRTWKPMQTHKPGL